MKMDVDKDVVFIYIFFGGGGVGGWGGVEFITN